MRIVFELIAGKDWSKPLVVLCLISAESGHSGVASQSQKGNHDHQQHIGRRPCKCKQCYDVGEPAGVIDQLVDSLAGKSLFRARYCKLLLVLRALSLKGEVALFVDTANMITNNDAVED